MKAMQKMKVYYFKLKRLFANFLFKKPLFVKIPNPIISFSFDDVPESTYTTGKNLLDKYGYKATYYVALGIKSDADATKPYFDHQQLANLVAEGHEIGCHTHHHLHCYTTPSKVLNHDLEQNQKALTKLLPAYKFKNFSYPYGEQSLSSKQVIKKRFNSGRGVQFGLNIGRIDLLNLKAVELMQGQKLETVYSWIDQAIQKNAWLIIYTHDIQENPSKWGCTPAFFESVLRYCSQKNIKGYTVNEALTMVSR